MDGPADRGHLATEQRHGRSRELDALSILDGIDLMIDDHRVVPEAVATAAPALAMLLEPLVQRMRDGGRLIYVGAGTSGRLGVLDAAECPPTFYSDPRQVVGVIAGGDASLRRSSEAREDDPRGSAEVLEELGVGPLDTVVAIAAGGTTPYVLGAVEIASAAGAMTALLTCVNPPRRPEGLDHLVVLDTGPELLTGSTRLKAGSATKLALNIISTTLFVQLGKAYSNLMVDLRATNDKLIDRGIRILVELCELSRDDAGTLLERAGGHVKTAVVMQRLSLPREEAEVRLNDADGQLRRVIGQ